MVGCITDSMDISLSKLREIAKGRGAWHVQFMGLQRVRHDLATGQQQIDFTGLIHQFSTTNPKVLLSTLLY